MNIGQLDTLVENKMEEKFEITGPGIL